MAISNAIRAEVETISDDQDSEISLTLDELVAGVKKAYENTYKGRFNGRFDKDFEVTLDGHSPESRKPTRTPTREGSTEGSTKTSRSRLTDTRRTRPKRATKSLTCR